MDSPDQDRRRWLALAVVLFAGFVDLLDVTIVNVAIPSILRDLRAESTEIQWIVAGYVLGGFAAVLITAGRLGDIFGRKRVFLIGMGGFTLASALCGLATGPAMLIGARFVQGVMAGMTVPQILAIIHATFAPAERAKAYGLFGGIMGSASVAGLIVGGLLVQWDLAGQGWRPIFLVNVPIGIASFVAAWFVIGESRSPTAPKLDLVGVALAFAAVLMLIYPLTEGRRLGWPVWTFLLTAGAVVLFALFVGYELRRTRTRTRSELVGMLGASFCWAQGAGQRRKARRWYQVTTAVMPRYPATSGRPNASPHTAPSPPNGTPAVSVIGTRNHIRSMDGPNSQAQGQRGEDDAGNGEGDVRRDDAQDNRGGMYRQTPVVVQATAFGQDDEPLGEQVERSDAAIATHCPEL